MSKETAVKDEIVEDDSLIALEKLERASPDMWEEKLPGLSNFLARSETPVYSSPPAWQRGLSQEDINAMHQLGVLSTNGLILEIKKIYDEAYRLGVMEAKEMTRGKYLGIFQNNRRKN